MSNLSETTELPTAVPTHEGRYSTASSCIKVEQGVPVLNVPGCRDLVDALSGQPYPAQFACKKGESYLFRMIL